jgi:hypothetical protein
MLGQTQITIVYMSLVELQFHFPVDFTTTSQSEQTGIWQLSSD